jgi:RNA polymerase sigma-70 factor (ECF subfamily)
VTPVERIELNRDLSALADGDRSSFNRVYHRVWPVIRSYAAKLLENHSDSEDAAQESLLKVFSRAADYRKDADALTWIYTLTTYECMTIRQKRRRRREDTDDSKFNQLESKHLGPEEQILTEDLRAAVRRALDDLSETDRETIVSMIYETTRPDVKAATFRKRLERALARFSSVWETKYGDT